MVCVGKIIGRLVRIYHHLNREWRGEERGRERESESAMWDDPKWLLGGLLEQWPDLIWETGLQGLALCAHLSHAGKHNDISALCLGSGLGSVCSPHESHSGPTYIQTPLQLVSV